MNFYRKLYFGLYRFLLRLPDEETAAYMSFIYIAICVSGNLMSVLIALGYRSYEHFGSVWVYGALFIIPIVIINYFYLYKNQENKSVLIQIQTNPDKYNRKERIAIIYVIISLIGPFIARLFR